MLTHVQELAQQLCTNENPNPRLCAQEILVPPEGAFALTHFATYRRHAGASDYR